MLTESMSLGQLSSGASGGSGSGGYEVGADGCYFLTCSIFLIHNPQP